MHRQSQRKASDSRSEQVTDGGHHSPQPPAETDGHEESGGGIQCDCADRRRDLDQGTDGRECDEDRHDRQLAGRQSAIGLIRQTILELGTGLDIAHGHYLLLVVMVGR